MGVYYDLVCAKHRSVLRLWKAYELTWYLHKLVDEGKRKRKEGLIQVEKEDFARIIEERPNPNTKFWLTRHGDCELLYGGDDTENQFNYYDGWFVYDTMTGTYRS